MTGPSVHTATCAPGYLGEAAVEACGEGAPYALRGCASKPQQGIQSILCRLQSIERDWMCCASLLGFDTPKEPDRRTCGVPEDTTGLLGLASRLADFKSTDNEKIVNAHEFP